MNISYSVLCLMVALALGLGALPRADWLSGRHSYAVCMQFVRYAAVEREVCVLSEVGGEVGFKRC